MICFASVTMIYTNCLERFGSSILYVPKILGKLTSLPLIRTRTLLYDPRPFEYVRIYYYPPTKEKEVNPGGGALISKTTVCAAQICLSENRPLQCSALQPKKDALTVHFYRILIPLQCRNIGNFPSIYKKNRRLLQFSTLTMHFGKNRPLQCSFPRLKNIPLGAAHPVCIFY